MDLGDFGKALAKVGLPLLGSVLPIPGGAALGAALAEHIGAPSDAPADIIETLTSNPDALQKAKEFAATHRETMLRLRLEHDAKMRAADSADIAAVNETMRTELQNSAQEAWYQKAWRPANGFAVAAGSFLSVFFVCLLFYKALTTPGDAASLAQVIGAVPNLATSIAMILGVPGAAVGIAAWHRGKQKREGVENP